MLKKDTCPVCEGYRRLKGKRRVGLKEEEYEMECWACRGSGEIWYEEDDRPRHLRTIVPGEENE